MGYVSIQNPTISSEQVFTVFQEGLADRFGVRRSALPAVDFIVKKSALVGVGIKLQHKRGETRLRCAPMIPSTLLRMLFGGGVLPFLFIWPVLRRTGKEVEAFAASRPELSGEAAIAAPSSDTRETPPPASVPSAAFVAAWIGITAFFVPSIVNSIFGYPGLLIARWVVVQAIATVVAALAVPRLATAAARRIGREPRAPRPIAVSVAAWFIGCLAPSVFSYGIPAEVRGWFTPHGVAEVAVVVASLFAFHRVIQGGNARSTRVAAARS